MHLSCHSTNHHQQQCLLYVFHSKDFRGYGTSHTRIKVSKLQLIHFIEYIERCLVLQVHFGILLLIPHDLEGLNEGIVGECRVGCHEALFLARQEHTLQCYALSWDTAPCVGVAIHYYGEGTWH